MAETKDVVVTEQVNEMIVSESEDYLSEVAGQGFENVDAKDTATPMLLIAQAMSDVVSNGTVKVGNFYNSITGEDYGNSVKVIVCHFDKQWVEWKPNQGGFVGRHRIGSIQVTGDPYTGLKHGENDIVETWQYLCILPEHPEAGYVIFGSTPGNLRYLKGWNTAMKYLRTKNGAACPMFGAVWELTTDKDKSKNGNTFYSCNKAGKSSIRQVGWTSKATYEKFVMPAREIAEAALQVPAEPAPVEETTEF